MITEGNAVTGGSGSRSSGSAGSGDSNSGSGGSSEEGGRSKPVGGVDFGAGEGDEKKKSACDGLKGKAKRDCKKLEKKK
ncbi:MAG TPA: hypothetical protein VLA72_13885 [Anaerolineales bacterium]|nr:hypothetical protein [Anaerolineales bacterium]